MRHRPSKTASPRRRPADGTRRGSLDQAPSRDPGRLAPRPPTGNFDAAPSTAGACNVRSIDDPAARHAGRARSGGVRRGPHQSGGPRASPRPLERRRDLGGAGQGLHFSHLVRGAARAATRVVPPQSDHSPPRSRRRRRRVSRPEPPRRARDAPHDPGQRRHRDSPLQRVRGGGPLRPGPPARRDSDHHGAVTLLLLIAALQADSASFAIRDFPFASGETLPVLRLHYLTLGRLRRDAGGSARNAVLILHGTGGSGSQFLSPLFAGELYGPGQPLDTTTHYLILPDNLGHGRSSKPSDGLKARFPHYT